MKKKRKYNKGGKLLSDIDTITKLATLFKSDMMDINKNPIKLSINSNPYGRRLKEGGSPDPDPSPYKKALKSVQTDREFDVDQFEKYKNFVAYAESKGKADAIQIPRKGYDAAPGRGKYQYELSDFGGSNSGQTAVKRAINFAKHYNIDLPKEVEALKDKRQVDFSKLSEDIQDFLFLADFRMKKGTSFDKLNEPLDLYVNTHWAGNEKERDSKKKWAEKQMAAFEKSLNKKQYKHGGYLNQSINPAFKDFLKGKVSLQEGGNLESENMKNFVGDSHGQGGIPIDAAGKITDNGSIEVEGDEKKIKYTNLPDKQGQSYVFPKSMKKIIEVLEKNTKYGDDIDLTTKELKMSKLEQANELRKILQAESTSKYLYGGGKIKASDGLGLDPLDPEDPMRRGYSTKADAPVRIDPLPKLKSNYKVEMGTPVRASSPEDAPSSGTIPNNKLDNIKNLGIARSIFNTAAAFKGLGNDDKFYNREQDNVRRLTNETLSFDNTALKNSVLAAANTASSKLRNAGRSLGGYRAGLTNIAANTSKNLADVELQKNQALASRKLGAAQILDNIGQQNRQEDIRVDTIQDQNSANAMNIVSQSMQDAINIAKYDNNIEVANKKAKEAMAILAQKYPDFKANPIYQKVLSGTATHEELNELYAEIIKFDDGKQ